MTAPVLERIALNVVTTLQGVTSAKYAYGLKVVERASGSILSPKPLTAIIYELSNDKLDGPQMCETWRQIFSIVVYVPASANDTTPVDVYNNNLAAAIHFEMMRDYTRGGLAEITEPLNYIMSPAEAGEYAGVTLNFAVTYRTKIDDPYTNAFL